MGSAKPIGADECRLAGLGDSLPDLTGRQKGKKKKSCRLGETSVSSF